MMSMPSTCFFLFLSSGVEVLAERSQRFSQGVNYQTILFSLGIQMSY